MVTDALLVQPKPSVIVKFLVPLVLAVILFAVLPPVQA